MKYEQLTTSEVKELSYEELVKQLNNLYGKLKEVTEENNALRWSLTTSYEEMNEWRNRSDVWHELYDDEHERAEKLYDDLEELKKQKEKLNHKGYESNTISSNFKDFEINSSPSKTTISCEGRCCFEGTSGTNTNKYDTEQIIENCTVKIWSNSDTGNVKIGWWNNDK